MILIWDNVQSFQQHLEDMRLFRNSHPHDVTTTDFKAIKAMPEPFDVTLPRETGLIKSVYDAKGKLILVPIWRVVPHKGSQN